ncbi:cupin domain-containing protein [Micropruina sonneratiae]|uniref:cupin domain-containing protein n=1 Tax=Micropruina sonneratiae TaxID=2986940 RepID=UPI0022268245|nr:cupin domain-containing protein [Micropruina sp. KQZ13P-5]MCW3158531.1 cupin domain-containing protein [Micropruina sp. KQZ13P-5]
MDPLTLLAGDPSTFIEEVWGRRILVHKVEPGLLEGIFGIDQADHLLTETAMRTPQLRLAKNGSVLPESRYTRYATIAGKQLTGLVDARRLLDEFENGATVVFQGLQRYWQPLRALVRGLEEQLGHPCQANAYLTPPGSQGFALHSDTHDVFVFQTYGAKQWEVHDEGGAHQVMMLPGTSMYLPTGTPHAARTQATASLHVTLGINRYVWRDLLKRVVDPLLEKADDPLPAALFADPDALAAALRERLATFAEAVRDADAGAVVKRHERVFASGRQPLLGGALMDVLDAPGLASGTALRRRPGSTCLLRPAGENLLLLLGDRRVSVPARIRPAIEAVLARDELTPADLHDVLDEQSAIVLARRLVREGLLEVVR